MPGSIVNIRRPCVVVVRIAGAGDIFYARTAAAST